LYFGFVAGIALPDAFKESTVNLVSDFKEPGTDQLEEAHRPFLESLRQQSVVRVGQRADRQVPRFIPGEPGVIEQNAHQLGNRHRRVCIIQLNGNLIR